MSKSSEENTNTDTDNNKNENKVEDLKKVLLDFKSDLLLVYPELQENMDSNFANLEDEECFSKVVEHVKQVFPERFFDILYKNEDIFTEANTNTEFLPKIDFKSLYNDEISDNTKDTIWKYLQVILFSVISDIKSEDSFGDTAKLFEAINEDELKGKLEETFENLQNLMSENMEDGSGVDISGSDFLPNPEDVQQHINGLLDGKLGNLAKEIAEETAEELNIDGVNSVNDVFQTLFKNPTKLMGLVKSVGNKLDDKIKSGEIKESELMEEASDILNKMKNMPGMGNFQDMFGKMAGGMGGSGGGKMNFGAMQNALSNNLKTAKTKERLQKKLQENMKNKEDAANNTQPVQQLSESELNELVFSIEGSTPEKTPRKPPSNKGNKKKKKGKKNK
jgi:hypothetical protein